MEKTSLRPALTMPQEEMCSLADFLEFWETPLVCSFCSCSPKMDIV